MSRRVFAWIGVAAWAALIFIGSAQPGSRIPGRFSQVGHLTEYAIFGALLALALMSTRPWRSALFATAIASVYGITDEFHQSFVPARTPDPADWALDTLGALAGAVLVAWLVTRLALGKRDDDRAARSGLEDSGA